MNVLLLVIKEIIVIIIWISHILFIFIFSYIYIYIYEYMNDRYINFFLINKINKIGIKNKNLNWKCNKIE